MNEITHGVRHRNVDAPDAVTPFLQWCATKGISRATGYRLLAMGKIEGVKIGRSLGITGPSSKAWTESLPRFTSNSQNAA